jgi:hypothetical protein
MTLTCKPPCPGLRIMCRTCCQSRNIIASKDFILLYSVQTVRLFNIAHICVHNCTYRIHVPIKSLLRCPAMVR